MPEDGEIRAFGKLLHQSKLW